MKREVILQRKKVGKNTVFIEKRIVVYGYDEKGEFVYKRLSKIKVYDTENKKLSYWFADGTNLKYYNSSQEKEKIEKWENIRLY